MLPEPFSLASSIITFIDGISKLKDGLSKIPEEGRRLRQLKADILRELDALERFCRSHYLAWNETEAQEVMGALQQLHSDFRDIQALCEIHLAAGAGGILRPARLKSWFKRSAIEADIRRLEQKIRSCQFRFMLFSCARTEYNMVTNQQENRDRLGHIENLVSYMLLRNARSNSQPPFSFLHNDAPDEVDVTFLSYQIQRLVGGLDTVMSKWHNAVELPSPDCALIAEPGLVNDAGLVFRTALISSLRSWHVMSSPEGFTLQGLVIPMIELLNLLQVPAMFNACTPTTRQNLLKLAEFSIGALEVLTSLNGCEPFEQVLALARHLATFTSTSLRDPRALFFAEKALTAWQAQFERHSDYTSLVYLSLALDNYNFNLYRQNKLEEALDCSRQGLLRRSSTLTTAPRSPGVHQERPM
ncbi:hypothetical protein HGRIS_014918 [Hohenbuehelia grisea]|uniref:Uncharacterized protein n=1 Tax=Hohenbuehelia grisea TaxID=104357 RepID=A0ABR3JF15_9AGAR